MAKENESELEVFTNKLTRKNKRDLEIYAAKKDKFLYEVLNEAIAAGLKGLVSIKTGKFEK